MDWKKLGKRVLFPPVWVMAILTGFSVIALVWIFLQGMEQTAVACIVYVLAFYTLSVVTVYCVMVLPKRWKQIKGRIYENPFGNRYLTDDAYRTKVSLSVSFGINLIYVGINLWSFWYVRSWWFMVLAVYYMIMALMRFLLVGYVRKNDIGTSVLKEWKRSRICAAILLLVNLSLSGAVLMILYRSKGYEYPGMMIYVMALYTFYSTIHAIMDIIKYRSFGSPIMSTAKIVSLCAALVSMLNLETAMFAQFGGEMTPEGQRIFIILTGAGVSVAVVTLSVLRIVKATKEIRRMKYGE